MRRAETDYLLSLLLARQPELSDLNFTVGRPFQAAVHGQLFPVPVEPPPLSTIERLTPFQTEVLAQNLIDGDRRLLKALVEQGACDLSYGIPGRARFRANVFSQRGVFSCVLRQLPMEVPTIAELRLPRAFNLMAREVNGLILVTGATGSGKSTALAGLIREMNEGRQAHIVTLEDPIEFSHPSLKSTVNQRELGADFDTFSNGLRSALRQAPNVILVGEIRDRETMDLALTAAETGHLVLSTLHSVDAGQTISRIIGLFEKDEERQLRMRLADALRWVVGLRLVPKVGGGRCLVHDILQNNMRAKESILLGESEGKTFYEIQEQSQSTYHMMTYDQSLTTAFAEGYIAEDTAMTYATRRGVVGRNIDPVKQSRGILTTDIKEVGIDHDYNRALKNRR